MRAMKEHFVEYNQPLSAQWEKEGSEMWNRESGNSFCRLIETGDGSDLYRETF